MSHVGHGTPSWMWNKKEDISYLLPMLLWGHQPRKVTRVMDGLQLLEDVDVGHALHGVVHHPDTWTCSWNNNRGGCHSMF